MDQGGFTAIRDSGAPRNGQTFADRMEIIVRMCGNVPALARKADVSDSVVRKWKNGDSEPNVGNLVRLARAAGVSVGWLASGQGAPGRIAGDAEEGDDWAPLLEAVKLAVTHAEYWRKANPEYMIGPEHLGRALSVMAVEIHDRGADQAGKIVERMLSVAARRVV